MRSNQVVHGKFSSRQRITYLPKGKHRKQMILSWYDVKEFKNLTVLLDSVIRF